MHSAKLKPNKLKRDLKQLFNPYQSDHFKVIETKLMRANFFNFLKTSISK